MTNNEIITNEVKSKYTAEQIHEMATAHFMPLQIAALAAGLEITDEEGNQLDPTPFAELSLVASLFHTYAEWKREGRNVKQGEKTAIKTRLWKYTTKPTAAQRREAEEAGEEAEGRAHYYKAAAYLFFIDQTERTEDSKPQGRTAEEIAAYNEQLRQERKAARAAKLSKQ